MKERLLNGKSTDFIDRLKENLKLDIARHYKIARERGCKDILWSYEGLYLLNSIEEYSRLKHLFSEYSSSVECVCCFRDVQSYQKSYAEQLSKNKIMLSDVKDSYHYLKNDSWLFNYPLKMALLNEVFDKTITFEYNQ
jgi:hypothetical protein